MRLAELLEYAVEQLAEAGVPEYQLDARLLLEGCLDITRTDLILNGQAEVDETSQERFLGCIERRKKREPVAYILGEQEFWSMPFYVSPAVLIPRPETEFLLDRVFALTLAENFRRGAVLDLCCGSGVIATVLAKETGKRIIASDISIAALQVAGKNLRRHHLAGQVDLVQGDLLTPFRQGGYVFSLIVANPPYVSNIVVQSGLEPEVARHEPHLALDGGKGGLAIIEELRLSLPRVLCPGGQVFMEIGADQGEAVRRLFSADLPGNPSFRSVDILVDYAGRDRVLHARKAG
jgi:release factor glutamine methyltransferase